MVMHFLSPLALALVHPALCALDGVHLLPLALNPLLVSLDDGQVHPALCALKSYVQLLNIDSITRLLVETAASPRRTRRAAAAGGPPCFSHGHHRMVQLSLRPICPEIDPQVVRR